METKTPQTTIRDYLRNVGTENDVWRSLRRRSVAGDPEGGSSSEIVPNSASKQQGRKRESGSPRVTKRIRSLASSEEKEVTPRHIIQNMLTVQGTAQPVTRRKRHMSDGVMGPPLSSSRHKTARRQSVSLMDLDDIVDKYTPRTNVAGFLEQAPEETPAIRKTGPMTDGHSTTHNVSSLMLNEVGVSLLEARSNGNALVNVSASAGRFRGKKGKLNIPLPQVSPVQPSQTATGSRTSTPIQNKKQQTPESRKGSRTSTPIRNTRQTPESRKGSRSSTPMWNTRLQTPESARGSRTSTPRQNRGAMASENVVIATSEVMSPVSSLSHLHKDAQDTDTSKSGPDDTSAGALDTSDVSEGEKSKGSERNVSDIFGENDSMNTSHGNEDQEEVEAAGSETLEQRRQQETEHMQGSYKALTPSMALSSSSRKGDSTVNAILPSSDRKGDSTRTSFGASPSSSSRKGESSPSPSKTLPRSSRSSSQKILNQLRQSSSTKASPAERRQNESPLPDTTFQKKLPTASTPVASSPPPLVVSGLEKTSLNMSTPKGPSSVSSSPACRTRARGKSSVQTIHSQLLRDEGDGHSNMPSCSQLLVSRFSSHFENHESTHILRHESEGPPALHTEEIDDGTSVFAKTATENFEMPIPTHWPSDQEEESSEGEEYSPLKTPRLPEKQRTPNTPDMTLSRLSDRNKNAEDTQSALTAGTKRKASTASCSTKKLRLGLPASVVKALFSHFCQLRVSKEAIEEVEKMSEQYWKNTAEDLEAYALHAHRQTINESDVELLMKRQGFITNTCSLNTLIAKYLPLELRQEMIPIARSGNKLEPKR